MKCGRCAKPLSGFEKMGISAILSDGSNCIPGGMMVCVDCARTYGKERFEASAQANTLQDSGERRQFDSGAVRDISEGKGRCDLLPLDVIDDLIISHSNVQNSNVLLYVEHFKKSKDVRDIERSIFAFSNRIGMDLYTLMLEVSKHFEAGAQKYGENNWKKGIPLHCYIDSGVRHYLKHLRGDTDEPHDRAFIWNMLCAIWTFVHKPELDDIEIDLAENP